MRNLLYLICIFTIGCTKNTDRISELRQIELLIPIAADSALILIGNFDNQSLKGENEIAYYSLIYSILLDKNYIDVESDSLIRKAVKYYSKAGDSQKRADSYFYEGRVYHNRGDYALALESYLKAEQACTESGDKDLMARINSQIGMIYLEFREIEKSIERLSMAAELNNELGKKYHEAYCRLQIAKNMNILENLNEGLISAHNALNIYKELGYKQDIAHSVVFITTLLYRQGDARNALDFFESELINYNIPIISEAYPILSRIYLTLDRIEEAQLYCEEFFRTGNLSLKDELFYYIHMQKIYTKIGDYKNALSCAVKNSELHDKVTEYNENLRITEIEEKYNNQLLLLKNHNLKRYNKLLWVMGFVSILFLTTLFLYLLKIRNDALAAKDRKLDEYNISIERLRDMTRGLSNKLDEKSQLEKQLKVSLENRINGFRDMLEMASQFQYKPEKFLDKFKHNIQKLHKESYLTDLPLIVDTKCNGIITAIKTRHPALKKDDIIYISLVCLGFDNNEIALIYGNTHSNSIYVRSNRVREKMGLLNKNKHLKTYLTEIIETKTP